MLRRTTLLFALLLPGPAMAVCTSDVDVVDDLTCSSTYSGSIVAADESQLGGDCEDDACYTCGDPHADEPQYAPEDVYGFKCQLEGEVMMLISELPCDLDIYVLDESCDPYEGCLHGSTAAYAVDDSVTFSCSPGEMYYVVVEAYGVEHLDVASGPCTTTGDSTGEIFDPTYTLSFDVSASTGCNEDCGDGEDNDLDGDTDCDDSDCNIDDPCCDMDGDGYEKSDCGGDDCDDEDAGIHPGAEDIESNGIDEDCDGEDAVPEEEEEEEEEEQSGTEDSGSEDEWPAFGADAEDDKGCGCASAPAAPPAILLSVLGILGLRRRS